MEQHPDDEFVQGAAIAAMKYLTSGECSTNKADGCDKATACAPIASADHYDIESAKLLHEQGARDHIARAVSTHTGNAFLQEDAKKVLHNIDYATVLHNALDIDGD